jgi:hypothetical protein
LHAANVCCEQTVDQPSVFFEQTPALVHMKVPTTNRLEV